ncbi:MAG: hypothetical protein CL762_00785 [Chloroflexi bacterium]|nr:hypothetical protein [Chloroflexota bacterium]
MNRFLENISNLFNNNEKGIGFGNNTKAKKTRRILLFQLLNENEHIYDKYIDGLIYKDVEFDKLKKPIKKTKLNGIFFPDKMITLGKLENHNFDFAVLHDLNISSDYLLSDCVAAGFFIDNYLDDATYDAINNIPFSFVVIDLIKKPRFDTLSGIFDLSKIISNIDNNILLKLNYIPSKKTLELLNQFGVIGIIIDSEILNDDKLKLLNEDLINLKGDLKKRQIAYPAIGNNMDSISYDDEE